MKSITIGLCGLAFCSGNMGCSALAYSFVKLLHEATRESGGIRLVIFENIPSDRAELPYDNITGIRRVRYRLSRPENLPEVRRALKECDIVFDFTEGDSFADIYGGKRFASIALIKRLAIKNSGKLVLGPQTYGPFEKSWTAKIARSLLKDAYRVFARDEASARYVKELTGREVSVVTDVAFALPYERRRFDGEKRRIGINVSGLLWNNGYTGKNEFGLSVNYREYITRLVEYCLKSESEVHLISHVICDDYDTVENDERAIDELLRAYPGCVKAPAFLTPVEAKGYISGMQVFLGARMHATIAAFSSGVNVIPFSYSRKFEGLYDSLGYPFCIHGKTMDTDAALEASIAYIEDYDAVRERLMRGRDIVDAKLGDFTAQLARLCADSM